MDFGRVEYQSRTKNFRAIAYFPTRSLGDYATYQEAADRLREYVAGLSPFTRRALTGKLPMKATW